MLTQKSLQALGVVHNRREVSAKLRCSFLLNVFMGW